MINTFKPLEHSQSEVDVLESIGSILIIWNDDVNTFDWVIQSLIEVCDHDPIQAEQCTITIHYKGKCDVKKGAYDELTKMKEALHDRGINAEVQES